MTTPVWQAGHLYLPGDLVRPVTQPTQTSTAITNSGFETGDATGWTLGAGMSVSSGGAFSGAYKLICTGTGGSTNLVHTAVAVTPGRSITASCMYQQGSASAGNNVGCVFLRWYTSGMVQIGTDVKGNLVSSGSGGAYNQSVVTAVAPATAAFVSIGGNVVRDDSDSSAFDVFTWNYAASTLPPGLIYQAVQAGPATSASSEPAWPVTVGLTVVDGGVTWEAVQTSRVVWEASPILKSGATEPAWPTTPGAYVEDGTIKWECVSRRIEDVNCPNTAVVVIVASKVFAADGDIVRYSATANPLDWTTPDDAGYLPTGLQQANSNDMAVANQYRGNAVFFNASSFQNWQADPDPAAMAILDQMDGVGSVHQKAAQPVANDLFYLASLGVRSIGIANATENLSAGDVGMPIDPLVIEAVIAATAINVRGLATYYPSAGQYWLSFSDVPGTPGADVLRLTCAPGGGVEGNPYSYTYEVAGGELPYIFSVVSGSLPPGLTLDEDTGEISGTPTTEGEYSFGVQVMDANGVVAFCGNSSTVVEDEVEILPPVAWLSDGAPTGFSVNPSTTGIDWTLPGWNITSFNAGRFVRRASDGALIVWSVTDTHKFGFSADDGASFSMYNTVGMNATAHIIGYSGGYWHCCSTSSATRVTDGGVQDTAAGATGFQTMCIATNRLVGFKLDRVWHADADGTNWSDVADMPILTLASGSFRAKMGGASGTEICMSAYLDQGITWKLYVLRSTDNGATFTTHTPMADIPDPGSGLNTLNWYDPTLGLWAVVLLNKVCFGPSIDALLPAAYTFTGTVNDIGSDGAKFLFATGDGIIATTDFITFTPVYTVGGVASLVALGSI